MSNITINFVKHNVELRAPMYSTAGAAGIDFFCPKQIAIPAKKDVLIDLEISLEIPENKCILLVNKSGIAVNKKLILGACLIDSDYRGNIHAHLFNLGDKEITLYVNDKICQGILLNCNSTYTVQLNQVLSLSDSVRGSKGFGSTNHD